MEREPKHHYLTAGEIVQEGDEVDACYNPMTDDPVWKRALCIGQPAPDPQFPAHRVYRRLIKKEGE